MPNKSTMNEKTFSGIGNRGSNASVASGPKAMEAQVISEATKTAIVAARSILLSGGSENVALKTAKAAAESVLNPSVSDSDTISARSVTFLRRRKAKRQAEVVASMALMTASANVRDGMSSDWSAGDSQAGSHLNPYTRNITTRSMNTQDEPSVLSGSTRPPKPSTPRGADGMKSINCHGTNGNMFVLAEQEEAVAENAIPQNPHVTPTKSPIVKPPDSSTATALLGPSFDTAQPLHENRDKSEDLREPTEAPKYTLVLPIASSSSDEEDGSDSVTTASNTSIESNDHTTTNDERTALGTVSRNNLWKELDPLMNALSTALNLFTCGPISAFTATIENDENSVSSDHFGDETTVDDSMADTYDERDDATTDIRSIESEENSHHRTRMILIPSSSAESSVDSASLLQELSSTSVSEAEILVRSSIRDTMEKIINKSKLNLPNEDSFDRKWLSYELKQDTQAPKTPNTPSKRKQPFFFKRKANKVSS